MFRVALESVLGFSLRGGREIALQPCIPHDWAGFTIRYRPPDGGTCTIEVVQDAVAHETRATMNGTPLVVREGVVIIPLPRAGMVQHVHVVLGSDVRARYEPRPA
jgi:cyclic beta-1,2-glucan synthetase